MNASDCPTVTGNSDCPTVTGNTVATKTRQNLCSYGDYGFVRDSL